MRYEMFIFLDIVIYYSICRLKNDHLFLKSWQRSIEIYRA